ncbi:MAG: Holliday junction resolvase-like protein [Candidatus Aenigmatarchaeota archaeon]
MISEILISFFIALSILIFFKYLEISRKLHEKAFELFQKWKEKELEKEAIERAKILLEKWLLEKEKKIREDAIQKSLSTIIGKVGEQLAPIFFLKNYGINPKDVRFIGSPIDFIAFKNLSENKPEKIIFIEVKSGKSNLSEKEKMIKELINKKRVEFLEVDIEEEIKKLNYSKLR